MKKELGYAQRLALITVKFESGDRESLKNYRHLRLTRITKL